MKTYAFKVGGQSFSARIMEYTETKVVVELNGNTYEVELSFEDQATAQSPVAPSRKPLPAARAETGSEPRAQETPADKATSQGGSSSARESQSTRQPAPSSGDVVAPIPGVVKQIPVSVGDKVDESTVVIVLEAMKMENQITARVQGTVAAIAVASGDSVQEGQVLVRIEVA